MLRPVDFRLRWCHRRLGPFRYAFLAQCSSAEIANDADECATISARIAFGRALLIPAGATHHKILFAQILRHLNSSLKLSPDYTSGYLTSQRVFRNANCEKSRSPAVAESGLAGYLVSCPCY